MRTKNIIFHYTVPAADAWDEWGPQHVCMYMVSHTITSTVRYMNENVRPLSSMKLVSYLFLLYPPCSYDMTTPLGNKSMTRRTLETLKKCSQLPLSKPVDERLGSKFPPLLEIDIDHIVVDELHLLLRVMEVLYVTSYTRWSSWTAALPLHIIWVR